MRNLPENPTMSLQEAQDLYREAEHVYIFTGAGMSVPLGSAPYWTGNGAAYGGEETAYGLTVLQHVKAQYWDHYEAEQLSYFRELYTKFAELENLKNTHYHTLLKSLEDAGKDYFSITSNVDNAFYNYGFDSSKLYEVHGTTRFSQCLTAPEFHGIFPTTKPELGTAVCPECGSTARPNTLFFDDYLFNQKMELIQYNQYLGWKQKADDRKSLILEIGAGTTVTTIRNTGLRLHAYQGIPYIRINPTPYPTPADERRERQIPRPGDSKFITLELAADEGIEQIVG